MRSAAPSHRPFERVYTITDYWDGPREGIADFGGVPHLYRSIWDEEQDDWDAADRFELRPVSAEALALALEDWAIWERFERAYRAGEVGWDGNDATWGALPPERARQRELKASLAQTLAAELGLRSIARGEFRVREPVPELPAGALRPLEVRWTPVDSVASAI